MSTVSYTCDSDPSDPPPRSCPDLDVRALEKRTRLMRIITRLIAISDLGSRDIARRAGLPAQKVSDLLSGRLEQLSFEELHTLHETLSDELSVS